MISLHRHRHRHSASMLYNRSNLFRVIATAVMYCMSLCWSPMSWKNLSSLPLMLNLQHIKHKLLQRNIWKALSSKSSKNPPYAQDWKKCSLLEDSNVQDIENCLIYIHISRFRKRTLSLKVFRSALDILRAKTFVHNYTYISPVCLFFYFALIYCFLRQL